MARQPTQSIPVYTSSQFFVASGANMGDGISFGDELNLNDIYELAGGAALAHLSLKPRDTRHFDITPSSTLGTAGASVHLDTCATFMGDDGQTFEVLILVEVDENGDVAEVYALPLMSLSAKTNYSLVGFSRETALQKFGEVACVSFSRGTHITMASGAQVPIEDLAVGDRVLTRDDGPQVIKWIGETTVRAVGEFAPIRIAAGTLHNENDLILSPEHRLFIYQRTDELGAGRAEVVIKARHLVNDDTVTRLDGGFVDYFQLLFEHHQIIFAEGIAAETLLIDPRTRAALPDDLPDTVGAHDGPIHADFDVQEGLVDRADAVEALRRSTQG